VVGTARWGIEFAGATVGALTGTGSTVGQILLVPLLAVLAWGVLRADAGRRPRVIALMVVLAGSWASITASRAGLQPPTTSRYLYVGGVLLVVTLGECAAGIALRRTATAVIGAVVVWAVAMNAIALFDGRDELLGYTRQKLAEISAIEIGTRTVDPAYAAVRRPPPIDGRPLVEAFDALGSPALDVAGVRALPDRYRRQADGYLAATLGMPLLPATTSSGPPPLVTRGDGAAEVGQSCLRFLPGPDGVTVELRSRTPFLRIEALGTDAVEVRVRAFGRRSFASDPYATVPDGEARDLPTPRSAAPPWRVGLRSRGAVEVCGANL
jgi:hypothetical protein